MEPVGWVAAVRLRLQVRPSREDFDEEVVGTVERHLLCKEFQYCHALLKKSTLSPSLYVNKEVIDRLTVTTTTFN